MPASATFRSRSRAVRQSRRAAPFFGALPAASASGRASLSHSASHFPQDHPRESRSGVCDATSAVPRRFVVLSVIGKRSCHRCTPDRSVVGSKNPEYRNMKLWNFREIRSKVGGKPATIDVALQSSMVGQSTSRRSQYRTMPAPSGLPHIARQFHNSAWHMVSFGAGNNNRRLTESNLPTENPFGLSSDANASRKFFKPSEIDAESMSRTHSARNVAASAGHSRQRHFEKLSRVLVLDDNAAAAEIIVAAQSPASILACISAARASSKLVPVFVEHDGFGDNMKIINGHENRYRNERKIALTWTLWNGR